MTIHTKPQSTTSRPQTQILNFSAYGPNNQDHAIQSTYRRTPDDTYIQSMPSGEVLSFVAASSDTDADDGSGTDGRPPKSRSKLLWANTFSIPMYVAEFLSMVALADGQLGLASRSSTSSALRHDNNRSCSSSHNRASRTSSPHLVPITPRFQI